MTEPSEWAKERATQIRYTLEFVCADRESKDATIAAALDEARDSILARLRNPDEAMVEMLRYDFHRERAISIIRALADVLEKGKIDD